MGKQATNRGSKASTALRSSVRTGEHGNGMVHKAELALHESGETSIGEW